VKEREGDPNIRVSNLLTCTRIFPRTLRYDPIPIAHGISSTSIDLDSQRRIAVPDCKSYRTDIGS
jgi:hypothetical protein